MWLSWEYGVEHLEPDEMRSRWKWWLRILGVVLNIYLLVSSFILEDEKLRNNRIQTFWYQENSWYRKYLTFFFFFFWKIREFWNFQTSFLVINKFAQKKIILTSLKIQWKFRKREHLMEIIFWESDARSKVLKLKKVVPNKENLLYTFYNFRLCFAIVTLVISTI
jgi:hypothetical protein